MLGEAFAVVFIPVECCNPWIKLINHWFSAGGCIVSSIKLLFGPFYSFSTPGNTHDHYAIIEFKSQLTVLLCQI